jgi:hypothetical protein
MTVQSTVVWVVMPHSLEKAWSLPPASAGFLLACSLTLKVEVMCSSEMPSCHRTRQCYNSEDHTVQKYHSSPTQRLTHPTHFTLKMEAARSSDMLTALVSSTQCKYPRAEPTSAVNHCGKA